MMFASAHGLTAFWYMTRATGIISLLLLTSTVVVGLLASVGWTTYAWPRFASQSLHRNLSLLCLVFIALHVASTVADGYVPIGIVDAFLPFHSPYRPLWIGLGAVALDLLLAVAITSGLRRWIGSRSWRGVHLLAYLCWPVALLHALGSGTDTRLGVTMVLDITCVAAVAVAGTWRLVASRSIGAKWRLLVGATAIVVLVGVAIFADQGPLKPGWSHRAAAAQGVVTSGGVRHATGSPEW